MRDGRTELLEAAKGAFATLGYSGSTTAIIAKRARVTQPLVYHHFKSKKALWNAVVQDLFEKLDEALLAAQKRCAGQPQATHLKEMLRAFIRFSGRNPELGRIVRLEGTGELFDELYTRWLSRFATMYRGLIEQAVAGKAVRDIDPTLLFYVILGAASEAFALPKLGKKSFGHDQTRPEFVDQYADLVVEVIFRGIAPNTA